MSNTPENMIVDSEDVSGESIDRVGKRTLGELEECEGKESVLFIPVDVLWLITTQQPRNTESRRPYRGHKPQEETGDQQRWVNAQRPPTTTLDHCPKGFGHQANVLGLSSASV